MKKLFMLLALVLGVVSCQNEPEGFGVVVGGEQDVNITVSLPESTRGDSADGFDLTNLGNYSIRYILEVAYNGNIHRDAQISKNRSASFPVRLAPGREYTFTVWADLVTATTIDKANWSATDNFYNTSAGLSNITFNTWTPNTEARDAWTDTKKVTFTGASDVQMNLTRPFAKVRVVATDIAEIRKFGIEPTNAVAEYFTAEMYTKFNAVTGVASDVATKKHEFDYTDATRYELTTDNSQFTVFTDYVFVPADGNVQFTLNVYDNTKGADALIKANSFNTTIPVEANKVTSIVGSVLTEGGNVNITVDSDLGVKETFTYISSGAELLKVIKNQNSGKYILGCNIDVDENDVALAGTLSATRSTTTETVINLNGYTITINNTSNKPLVTVAEGNTLTFAGAGNIVMTSESTAPFVENKNENGGVIIEEATVTNESTNQKATIVDGTAVVNEGVKIEGNVASEETTSQLDYVLANGGEVTLLQDVTSNDILEISATNPVVINGNGKTLTSSAGRAINVSGANDVTIKNLNIVASGERAINVIQNSKKVTIENVTATAANYTVNVAGSAPGAVVVIKNSTLNGLCTVNVASAGANVTVDGSTVNCNDNDTTEGESYAALCLNKNAVGGKIIATNSTINVTEGSDSTAGRNGAEDGVVTINGSVEGVVVTYAVITYPGSDYYYGFQTIAEAVEFAKNGDKISLIRDVELTKTVVIKDKEIVLDLNGKTISGKTSGTTNPQDLILVKGNLTVKNGTITTEHVGDNLGWSAMTTIFDITAGGVVNLNGVTAKNLGGTDMGFVAHLNNWGEVTLNVENSTLESNYVAVRVFNSGPDKNNVTIKNSTLKGGSYAFWVHNYTDADFVGTATNAEAQKALLNFDIFNGTNTFIGKNETPIRYGMTNAIYTEAGEIVSTAEELEAAIKAGGEYVLGANIAMTKSIAISNANFTLDGNGKTITMAEGATNTYALFDITGGKAAIKNITFDGIKSGAIVRTVDVEFNAENITAQNGQHTQQQGLFRLLGKSTIKDCTFKNNTCNMVVTLNFDANSNDYPQVIENCVFEGNTCNDTAVAYYVCGTGATINGNKFLNNRVYSVGNAATLYMGFTENHTITNNLFSGNNVTTTHATSKRATGGLMIGYEATISGNAFVGNTITAEGRQLGNDVCASVYYTDIDLSGNYWGGNAPVEGVNYYKEYTNHSVIINDYLTANPFN